MLELGSLPPCNRFTSDGVPVPRYPLVVAICSECALVQLCEYPAAEAVAPRVPWIVYNEPEAHLDEALGMVAPALGAAGRALGVTPFDDPLLERLTRGGWECSCVNLLEGVDVPDGIFPYLETLQMQMRSARMRALAASVGLADLVVCRYLLEHSHDPVASLVALAGLLKPGGRLLIEVPDSTKFLDRCDYSFLWEEHICYFTEPSLRRLIARAGLETLALYRGESLQEDHLAVVVGAEPDSAPAVTHDEATRFARFAADFPAVRAAYQDRLRQASLDGGKVALFGAGHQAIMFLNSLGLASNITLLADDHPDKLGTYAPGTNTPIVPSSALDADPALTLCLLSTNPRIEDEIRARLPNFLARGGRIYSIFTGIGRPTLVNSAA